MSFVVVIYFYLRHAHIIDEIATACLNHRVIEVVHLPPVIVVRLFTLAWNVYFFISISCYLQSLIALHGLSVVHMRPICEHQVLALGLIRSYIIITLWHVHQVAVKWWIQTPVQYGPSLIRNSVVNLVCLMIRFRNACNYVFVSLCIVLIMDIARVYVALHLHTSTDGFSARVSILYEISALILALVGLLMRTWLFLRVVSSTILGLWILLTLLRLLVFD